MRSSFTSTLLAGAAVVALAGCNKPAEPAPAADATVTEAPLADAEAVSDAATAPSTAAPSDAASGEGRGGRGPRGPQTLAEMQARMDRQFERRDVNGDGVITAEELNADEGGRGGRMLERADADEDGRITRAEVRLAAAAMFRRMDANGDGVVSEDERPQWGGRGGPPPPN